MVKRYLYISVLCILTGVQASAAAASAFMNFVPEGWKMLTSATGDLNADGMDDAVLVLENDDPANRKPNTGLGTSELNLNPRRLVVLLQSKGDYQIALRSDSFLPTENDAESPCLADPLTEGGGVNISKGLLKITLNYWLSCGGWGTSSEEYVFRHENGRFRLIGRNHHGFMRNSGEVTEYSVNYVTGKIKVIEGLNEFDEDASEPKTIWKSIPNNAPRYLDELSSVSFLEETH